MKKNVRRVLALLCALVMVFSLAACGGSGTQSGNAGQSADPGKEQMDENRTQLYVFNFAGGYGVEWLVKAKERFEELHKDDVLEEGKKGVQIVINNEKTQGNALDAQILDNRDEIYFAEHVSYYTLKSLGVLADITDAVTGDLSAYGDAAGSTIEGKLSESQKDFYDIDGKYYGVPHYAGYSGLVYNVDLFEEKGYYFKDGYGTPTEIEDYFAYGDDTRSTGPDGQLGTDDDGLPATYEEFGILCRYIQQTGNTPIIWTGAGHTTYVNNLIDALATDDEGYDQKMLQYTLDGTATTLGTVQNGKFVPDGKATDIASSPLDIFRQEGRYNALKFVENIVTNKYYFESVSGGSFNSGLSHMDAQDNFLFAGHDGETKPIAMLCEGVWWESEATDTFNEMVNSMGEEYSKHNRNFAMMPLPKASADKLGKSTLMDNIFSICFMKANVPEHKRDIAIEFIKFVNSDESLKEFSTVTNTPKALNYTMTDAEMASMSPFGRSVMKLKQSSDILYPVSSSELYANNQGQFDSHSLYWSMVGGKELQFASSAFYDSGITAEEYFSGMKDCYKLQWTFLK